MFYEKRIRILGKGKTALALKEKFINSSWYDDIDFDKYDLNSDDLTVVSPGTQKRNFTHVEDIISGLILVGENGFGDDFGIGSSESYSINDIAEMFGGKIILLPERRGNRMDAEVISKKVIELGWVPKYRVDEYISSSIRELDN